MRSLFALMLAVGCIEAPEPVLPVQQNVSVLVRDEFLLREGCSDLATFGVKATLEVTGIVGACNVRVKEDGTALTICDRIPGKEQRELILTLFTQQKTVIIELATVSKMLDLTAETREMVDVDFTWAQHIVNDDDGDGTSNVRELCSGSDPRNAGR